MKKNIYSAKVKNKLSYVKTYRKQNAIKFFKKRDGLITNEDVRKVNKIDPSVEIIDELYPEFVEENKKFKEGKYYNMFK